MLSHPEDHTLRAGLYMVLTTACFVGSDTCLKLIGTSLPVGETIAFIGLLSAIVIFFICAQQGILSSLPMILTRSVLMRSSLDVLGTFMFIPALMHMPIADLSTILQSVPLVVVVVAVAFLGEKAGLARIVAVVAGFLGVLLIVKPSLQNFTVYQLFALGTVVVVALRDIITKRIPAHVPLLVVALANATFVSISGFGLGLWQGFQKIEAWQLGLLSTAAILVSCGYILIVSTVRLGELSATAPFRYSEILFAILASVFIFREYPDLYSYSGMALIIAAGLYAARHEAIQNRNARDELILPTF